MQSALYPLYGRSWPMFWIYLLKVHLIESNYLFSIVTIFNSYETPQTASAAYLAYQSIQKPIKKCRQHFENSIRNRSGDRRQTTAINNHALCNIHKLRN